MLRGAFCAAFVSAAAAAVSLMVLKSKGLIPGGRPDRFEYPLRGAYVSESSGVIRWDGFAGESFDVFYIRVTKGSAFADRQAGHNLKGAAESGVLFGVVHDLDFASDGRAQADNFLSVKGVVSAGLIPALDIRMSFLERLRFRDKSRTAQIISDFAARIKEKTGSGILLLCDSYSFERFGIEGSGAAVWADGCSGGGFCGDPEMLSFSEDGASSALADSSAGFTLLAVRRILQNNRQNL